MLCLLIYLFSISLHFIFFIPLSPISIYQINDIYKDIKNILLFKYFRKNKV